MAKNNTPGFLASHGLRLFDLGYKVVPIPPGGKRPGISGWQHWEPSREKLVRMVGNGHALDGVGIRCRENPTVDADIHDPAMSDTLAAFVQNLVGITPKRVGLAPKWAMVYWTDEPFGKVSSPVYRDWITGMDHKVEILADGQQVVVYAIHPDTGLPYTWTGGGLIERPANELPKLTRDMAETIVAEFVRLAEAAGWQRVADGQATAVVDPDMTPDERALLHYKAPRGLSVDEIRRYLADIPADDRDEWLKVGMGLYHELEGSPEGFELWNEWSQTSDSYGGVTWKRWEGFAPDYERQAPVTIGTVQDLARRYRKEARRQEAGTGFDLFHWSDVSTTEDAPRQLVEDFLLYGSTSLVSAQPNTGKSAFALDLAVHVAAGRTWQGRQTCKGRVLYIAAESPVSIWVRILAYQARDPTLGDLPLDVVQSRVRLTEEEDRERFKADIADYVSRHGDTALVVADTFRAATPGVSENDAEMIGPVMADLQWLALEFDLHLMVIHHTTKAGNSYAGSGVFGAIVDTEIRIVDEEDLSVKDNRGCLVGQVVQQRALASKWSEFFYKIESQETGRLTNFGNPETAPFVTHITESELAEEAENRLQEAATAEESALYEDLEKVLAALRLGSGGGEEALADATGLSRRQAKKARDFGVETGHIRRVQGKSKTQTIYTIEGAENG